MSTVHVDQDVNRHLVNAVNRLKTLQHVHVIQELSSHYNYGTEEPYIRDRFRIEMGLQTKDIRCQVVLDSSNYYFPPDILFDPSVSISEVFDDVEELSALLPADNWDLKNENCLYDWFERLVGKLKKPPKSPSLSPPPDLPPKKKKKNWGIFNIENDSDDDLIISKEQKAISDDDFIPPESIRKSSNSKGKRPARNQHVEAKDSKRLKPFKEIGESKTYNVIDLDEEMAESSRDSQQAKKSSDIQLKEEKKAKPQCKNPYIDEASTLNFEFDGKSRSIDLEDRKAKPQCRNTYIDETSTMNFEFDGLPRNAELKDEESTAEGSMATEKKKNKKKNPYIDEASTIHFNFDIKPKATDHHKKNPYIDDFEQMKIDKPEVKKPKAIDLMQKKRKLTQGPSKEAAMRLQKETQWGEDFMAMWRRRFEQNIMKMDEADTSLLTIYMPYDIEDTSDQYQRYLEDKQRQLIEFRKAQGMRPTDKVLQPKPMAPMLVKLELISPTRLRVTLISVINTREQASDEVDSIDLTYDLNQENAMGSEFKRIKNDIKKQAIHFHLFQTKLVNY